MEDQASPSPNIMIPPTLARSLGLAESIAQQRRQIQELLANRRDRVARLEEEVRQLAEVRAELEASRTAWEESRREITRQQAEFLEELRSELLQRLDNVAGGNASGGSAGNADGGEYQKRYEMSLEDIRSLREENRAIAEELQELKSHPPAAKGMSKSDLPLSWEAQKQRLLASLEESFDENEPEATAQRLEMEELVKTTDLALSQKDEEIAELRQLLERQSENIGEVAVGAAAFGEIVDKDEIILQERQSLKVLQDELREKLRKAEIDISLERAKIARERVELDEKIRLLSQKKNGAVEGEDASSGPEKPTRGRWLSRLGLNDLDK